MFLKILMINNGENEQDLYLYKVREDDFKDK